jgi:hypothetical protein
VAPEAPGSRTLSRTARRAAAEDAKLLAGHPDAALQPVVFPRAFYLAFGFVGHHLAGGRPWPGLVPAAVPVPLRRHPGLRAHDLIGLRYPAWGKRALLGLLAGMIATGSTTFCGSADVRRALGRPHPQHRPPGHRDPDLPWYWGYVWRFVGNGGGMGIAFANAALAGVKLGIAYGTAVCLAWSPSSYFFPVAQLTSSP